MKWFKSLQKSRPFRFVSSVKLAVPLMFALLLAAAYGTVLESQYSAQVASVAVYRSSWFLILLILLWVNIFCATLARIPFRRGHTGFVITHIGLLTLLAGGTITSTLGTDGQLRVVQGASDDEVFLSDLILRVETDQGVLATQSFPRRTRPMLGSQLDTLNEAVGSGFAVDQYQPYVAIERGFSSEGGDSKDRALQFGMKSRFFDVKEWLSSHERSEMQMGPATLRLVVDSATRAATPVQIESHTKRVSAPSVPHRSSVRRVRVKAAKDGKVLAEWTLADLKKSPQSVGPVRVSLTGQYEEAMVAGKGGKLQDKGTVGKNPALEFKVEHQGQSLREVAFARFPGFSLQPNGAFGLKFDMIDSAASTPPESAASASSAAPAAKVVGTGNLIEFHVSDTKPEIVRVELFKNGQSVLRRDARAGEMIQTPWMGMELTLISAVRGGREVEIIKPAELLSRAPVPPSAIHLAIPGGAEGAWVIEGDRRQVPSETGARYVYFGPDSLRLPFKIALKKFSKVDYPGTETALSYESQVQVNGVGEEITVAMNEPLKQAGFTLYQSSYVLEPGKPPVSIFSVNRDPGRWIKYLGSLILVLGIAVFTIMRSSWYLKRSKKRAVAV